MKAFINKTVSKLKLSVIVFITLLNCQLAFSQCELTIGVSSPAYNCFVAKSDVVWKDTTSMTISGDTLTKYGSNAWNGGAFSTDTIGEGSFITTKLNETNRFRAIGLSNSNTNTSYTTIRHAFVMRNDGRIQIYESGINRGDFGQYYTDDVLKIGVIDNVVRYYINDQLLYSSSVVPTLPLHVDVSLHTIGATLSQVYIENGNSTNFVVFGNNLGASPTYQWHLNGTIVGAAATYTNAGLIDGDSLVCVVTPGVGGCQVGNDTSNSILFETKELAYFADAFVSNSSGAASCNLVKEQVVWSTLSSHIDETGTNIQKTSGTNGWNAIAMSNNTVANNGYASTVLQETNTYRIFGLSSSSILSTWTDVDFGFYIRADANIEIVESGINRGNFGSYTTGDTLKLSIESSNVLYYINQALVHTSVVSPSLPLFVDGCLHTNNATLNNILIANASSGNYTATAIGGGSAPAYQWKLNNVDVGTGISTYSNGSLSIDDSVTCVITPTISNCVATTVNANKTYYDEIDPSVFSKNSIINTSLDILCNRVVSEAGFTDETAGLNVTNNNLSKGGADAWNVGAASTGTIGNNSYASTIINETNTFRMFGLSNTNANESYTDIEYGFYLRNNGSLNIYESGVDLGDYGTYSSGDTLSIKIKNNTIHYYINSYKLYESGVAPTLPLLVDISLYSNGATLEQITLTDGTGGDFTAVTSNVGASPTYQWQINSGNVGANSPNYNNPSLAINDTVTCIVTPDFPGCASVSDVVSNRIRYFELDPADETVVTVENNAIFSYCNYIEEEVNWQQVTSNLTYNKNNLSKSGIAAWDAGAASLNTVKNNGYASTIINETNTYRLFGLSNSNADFNYTTIEYGFYIRATGNISIYESGIDRGNFGSYSNGDSLTIAVINNNVLYYKNDQLLFTSGTLPTLPLLVDVALLSNGATIEGVKVANGTAYNLTAAVLDGGTTPSYQWQINGANDGGNSPNFTVLIPNVGDTITCIVTPDAAGCTPGTKTSNAAYIIEKDPTIYTEAYINNTTTDDDCAQVSEQVSWINPSTNIKIDSNYYITKTGAIGWDAGARSSNNFTGNGGVYTVVNETTSDRMFGLTTNDVDFNYTGINYAIHLRADGQIDIYESGVLQTAAGSYSSGDTLMIDCSNDNITYLKNGVLLHSSSTGATYPLYVDCSLHTTSATLRNTYMMHGKTADFTAFVTNAGITPTYLWQLNGSNTATTTSTYNNPALAVYDTVTCLITPDFPGCPITPILSNKAIVISDSYSTNWIGTSNDWNTAGNWSNGVPNRFTNVTIPNGTPNTPTISGFNATCRTITIDFGASLSVDNGDTLSVYGDWDNSGTFVINQSTLVFHQNCANTATDFSNTTLQDIYNLTLNNPDGLSVTSGPVAVHGTILLDTGIFTTNDLVTISSDINGDGAIGAITGGDISGNVTVERYIDAGATDWRFMTAPISGATLNDWNDDINTSGFTGSDYPTWPTPGAPWSNINYYDETATGALSNGFTDPTNITNGINPGQGLWVWCGDTVTGTDPFTIDVTGAINKGDITLPVTFTSSAGISDDGWNMVGNPYPSVIDWESASWTKTNISTTIYIWNPDIQQFATYMTGGASTNGGSRYIASSQGFWVKATAVTNELSINENVKSRNTAAFLKTKKEQLSITLSNSTSKDEIILIPNTFASNNYMENEDALKLIAPNSKISSIGFKTPDNKTTVINQIAIESIAIPIQTNITSAGEYKLSFKNTIDIDQFECILIKDAKTSQVYDLNTADEITVYMDAQNTHSRFSLILSPDGTSGCEEMLSNINSIDTQELSYTANDETLLLSSTSEIIESINIINMNGQLIYNENAINKNKIELNYNTFTNHYSGAYLIQATFKDGTQKHITIIL